MTSTQPFALLYGDQPDTDNQDQSADHAAFRRSASKSPATKESDNLAGNAPAFGPEAPSANSSWSRNENAPSRGRTEEPPSVQPMPLASAPPTAAAEVATDVPTAPWPKAGKSAGPTLLKSAAVLTKTPTDNPVPNQAPDSASHRTLSWKKTALIVGIVVLLIAGVVCADYYFMPMLRYREAVQQEAKGNYDRATRLYTSLGNYRDCQDRLAQLPAKKATALMNEGNYQDAMDLLEAEDKESPLIADCLYALGVLVYNDGDAETGLAYTAKLNERFPDYPKTQELEQFCNYSLGQQYTEMAASANNYAQQSGSYELACKYFDAAGEYGDAEDRAMECRYRLFSGLSNLLPSRINTQKAVSILGEMGNYRDATSTRLRIMYNYVLENYIAPVGNTCYSIIKDDPVVNTFLEELAASNYEDAPALLDRLNGKGFSLELFYGDENTPLPDVVTDFSKVYIHCEIPRWENLEPVQPYLLFAFANENGFCSVPMEGDSGSATVCLDQIIEKNEEALGRFLVDSSENGKLTLVLTDGFLSVRSLLLDDEGNFSADKACVPSECVVSFRYERA